MAEAKNFEASIILKKYSQKQIKNGLRPPRHNIVEQLKIYSVTKTHLRPRSKQKFNAEIEVLKIFFNYLNALFGVKKMGKNKLMSIFAKRLNNRIFVHKYYLQD
jgi:hypothetical protein